MDLRCDIITIGHLSRNCFWGESNERAFRAACCTTTLIRGTDFTLLVDPAHENAEQMAFELFRRTGLPLSAVDAVFLTHDHTDHHAGLRHFPQAQWFAGEETAARVNASGCYDKAVLPVTGRLLATIDVIPTPGHCAGHQGLRFTTSIHAVVVAGDAVMTRDFWDHRTGMYHSQDMDAVVRTIDKLAEVADIIVPGHDNYFFTTRKTDAS